MAKLRLAGSGCGTGAACPQNMGNGCCRHHGRPRQECSHAWLTSFGVGLFTLAAAWSTTAVLASVAICNGRVKAHREWMIRSYVLTFTFVTFRVWLTLALALGLGEPRDLVPTVGWLSFVVPLFTTEVVLRWRETVTPASVAAPIAER